VSAPGRTNETRYFLLRFYGPDGRTASRQLSDHLKILTFERSRQPGESEPLAPNLSPCRRTGNPTLERRTVFSSSPSPHAVAVPGSSQYPSR
jgi:hypothetical protein